jgi:hypothetical protein
MKKSYCKVTLDFPGDNAYEYNYSSKVKTTIKFGRRFDGRFQTGEVKGQFGNKELHQIIFMIKRGYRINEIEEKQKEFNKVSE